MKSEIFDVNKLDVIKTSDEIQSSKEVGAC